MEILTKTKPIRSLMPEGFTRLIMAEMGGTASIISEVVNTEKITSKYWGAVKRLAKKTDAKAYEEREAFIKARVLKFKNCKAVA